MHTCVGDPLSRYTCRATRATTDLLVTAALKYLIDIAASGSLPVLPFLDFSVFYQGKPQTPKPLDKTGKTPTLRAENSLINLVRRRLVN